MPNCSGCGRHIITPVPPSETTVLTTTSQSVHRPPETDASRSDLPHVVRDSVMGPVARVSFMYRQYYDNCFAHGVHRMRILHLIDSLDPRLGGPQAVALRLAAAQASNGDSSAILTYRPDSEAAGPIAVSMRSIPGMVLVQMIEVGRPASLFGRVMSSAVEGWIRQHGRDWDVIHIHNIWDPAVRAGSAAARAAGIPYVIVPHASLDPWGMKQSFAKAAKKKVALALQMRSLIDSATFLHALNDEEERGISLMGFRSPQEVVPNGIFASEFEGLPAKGAFRAAFPSVGNRPFVLFLSRLHFKKGLDYLVESFAHASARVGDLQLVVAGPDHGGRSSMEKDVQER